MASSRFRKAIKRIKALEGCYQEGLGALRKSDKKRIRASNPRNLRGSADLDGCLKASAPRAYRWDYAIGYGGKEESVHYVEVHPASTSDIAIILKKHRWLQRWLKEPQARDLADLPAEYWWVASGKVKLLPTGRQVHQLTKAKIKGPTKRLTLR